MLNNFFTVVQKCTGVRVSLNPDQDNVEKSVKLGIRTVLECHVTYENTPTQEDSQWVFCYHV